MWGCDTRHAPVLASSREMSSIVDIGRDGSVARDVVSRHMHVVLLVVLLLSWSHLVISSASLVPTE